jgi:modulator of FtsH protease
MLLAQLERFPAQHAIRNANALALAEALAEVPGLTAQKRDERMDSQGNYCFVVHYDEREFAGMPLRRFEEALSADGVPLGLGLLLGLAVAPVLAVYAKADPSALYQAAGSTTLFVGALGSYGYATRRDLSSWARTLFWALLALIVFGLLAMFVAIPGGNVIYSVLGLVVFGGFTIFDFNRLRRAEMASAVPIAASIFLDIFNVFLLLLSLFGGGNRR